VSPPSSGAGDWNCSREMLPALKKTGRDLQKREEGQEPSENQKILIKATTEEPKLITFKDFIARAPPVLAGLEVPISTFGP
jgi:hypothetical protein